MSIATGFSMYFLSFLLLWISVLFVDAKKYSRGATSYLDRKD